MPYRNAKHWIRGRWKSGLEGAKPLDHFFLGALRDFFRSSLCPSPSQPGAVDRRLGASSARANAIRQQRGSCPVTELARFLVRGVEPARDGSPRGGVS
jgi:hypothetical protein